MLYILILVISGIAQFFGPWWSLPIVCFALCFWRSDSAKTAWVVSALAAATLWLGYAIFLHYVTQGVMTTKITQLFLQKLPYDAALIIVTGVLAGIVAGFAGLSGFYCRQAFAKTA
ncbi:MAG: hypothetical protein EAZ70_11965 [Runella slithyformis]|nr:MAG: hypothetical protein EAY79_08095 [Runella slithyformis]TAF24394.1 MAG: hypothetical protein EAZ70_11965 [Runella slithyformis]TAF49394.1 MAG: hypothetical protein EAZ63_01625 [Runella slithyformis]TAF79275.1 MAG: hypothetical protein EAZ50_11815 [Runella slithyformis]